MHNEDTNFTYKNVNNETCLMKTKTKQCYRQCKLTLIIKYNIILHYKTYIFTECNKKWKTLLIIAIDINKFMLQYAICVI